MYDGPDLLDDFYKSPVSIGNQLNHFDCSSPIHISGDDRLQKLVW